MPKSDHKRTSSKHKIDRRLGVNLWGRPKSPLNDREYAPGQHGQRRKKPTDYGVQLMAKQKLKGYYGNIGEKQFKKYYTAAVRQKGDTGANLIGILECRLDAILYRMKLAPTVLAHDKTYVAVVKFQEEVDESTLRDTLSHFSGTIYNVPPEISAVKVQVRTRNIHKIELLESTSDKSPINKHLQKR